MSPFNASLPSAQHILHELLPRLLPLDGCLYGLMNSIRTIKSLSLLFSLAMWKELIVKILDEPRNYQHKNSLSSEIWSTKRRDLLHSVISLTISGEDLLLLITYSLEIDIISEQSSCKCYK
uniref:Uncharacterized protein n=1 Tax=Glossina pallidipes TaxID=7398 RepID=A0A1A9ZVX2_GLOPL